MLKENSKIERISPIIFLFLFSITLISRLYLFGYPSEVVFDEFHFGKFVNAYLKKESFFDIHPPLGKLIIAGFTRIFAPSLPCSFQEIGQKCPPPTFYLLRTPVVIAGILLIPIFYLFLKELTSSKTTGFIGAFLLTIENAFVVQSRFGLLDIFLIFFGFLGLYLFLRFNEKRNFLCLFFSGLSLGASLSIKWTGASFFAIFLFFLIFKNKDRWKEKLKHLLLISLPFLFVYLFSFWIHFQLIPNQSEKKVFYEQALFVGEDFENLNFFQKIFRINKTMFSAQKTLKDVSHPYQSDPFFWPLMEKPIFYWLKDKKQIFLIGNPLLWYSSSFSFLLLIMAFIFKKIKKFFQYSYFLIFFFLFSFLINYLPFFFIQRSLFLYHYLAPYSFLIANLAFLIEKIREKNQFVALTFLALFFLSFFKNFAITYGL